MTDKPTSGTKQRRKREKERRRRDILDAAREVFFAHGFKHSSMDQIAERSQLAKGTLYLYFRNKEDLYVSLIEDGFKLLAGMIAGSVAEENDIESKILAIARSFNRFAKEHNDFFTIFSTLSAGDMRDIHERVDSDNLKRLYEQEKAEFSKSAALIEKGKTIGLFRADVDAQYSMRMIWSAIHGATLHCKNNKHGYFDTIDSEQMACDIVRGLLQSFKPAS